MRHRRWLLLDNRRLLLDYGFRLWYGVFDDRIWLWYHVLNERFWCDGRLCQRCTAISAKGFVRLCFSTTHWTHRRFLSGLLRALLRRSSRRLYGQLGLRGNRFQLRHRLRCRNRSFEWRSAVVAERFSGHVARTAGRADHTALGWGGS
jgi:hypothetical protein